MDDNEQKADKDSGEQKSVRVATESPAHHEEDVVETTHEVIINGTPVVYTAAAGRVLLKETDGRKRASFFFTAYTRNDIEYDPSRRPIIFLYDGGPGSSSVWLHLGGIGPRRAALDDEGFRVPPPGRLVANQHSILDVADLVFIDPISTGFSRAIPHESAKEFHDFNQDIDSVGEFITSFLSRHGRWASPKFLIGESYGTVRSAGVAGHLLDRHGVYFNGIVLISSILNFQTARFDRGNDLPYVLFLPTYAASAWYHGRLAANFQQLSLREFLDEVEAFATSEYATALFKGDLLPDEEFADIARRLALYTGLSEEYVSQYDLRIEIMRFCKELLRDEHRTVGRSDSRYKGIDRFKAGDTLESDPSRYARLGVYTAVLNDYIRRDLEYESELPYEIIHYESGQHWGYDNFNNAYVDVSETLRKTMSLNSDMKVMVASGYYDLATPHFASEYTFSHMGLDPEIRRNVEMQYYDAGHMMYMHIPSLEKLAGDIRDFIARAAG